MRNVILGCVLSAALAGAASAQVVVVPNNGFEAGNLGTGNYLYPNGVYQSWFYGAPNGNGSALINAQGANPFYGATPPTRTRGAQFAALQRDSTLRDDVIVSSASNYQFGWLAAGRPTSGNQSYTFSLFNGQTLVTPATSSMFATTSGSAFTENYIAYRNLQPGTYTLQFTGKATTDQTAFIDEVFGRLLTSGGVKVVSLLPAFAVAGIGAVPEASSWAMLIAGFGLVGLARRRRPVAAAG